MKRLFIFVFLLLPVLAFSANGKDYTKFIDTRIGTDSNFELSHGNTYPATGMPFAQHLWSPQTGDRYDGWKYSWPHEEIRGFEQTHQCSPWMQDYAVFILMPETGKLVTDLKERGAKFSHDKETARPNYYKVTFDNGITTEMAPTERCNMMRFSFPKKGDAILLLDGYNELSEIHLDPDRKEITGWVNNIRFIKDKESFRCHFVIRLDKPFQEYGVWKNEDGTIFPDQKDGEGKGYGAYIKFKPGTKVNARISSSYISLDQARLTLNRELGTFTKLEEVAAAGAKVWNALLGRVDVEGASEEEIRTFYSCLFRSNLFSRKFYEIGPDGEAYYYSPYDGQVHKGYMYTDNGFWDTFRSQFPLTNILHPEMQGRYMNALLDAQDQCGWLPQWSAPGETGGMVGNHAISLLADAWAKGIRSFDPERALKAYAHEAMNKGPWGGANGRGGWQDYWTLGYVSHKGGNGATAMTLEYAYDDFCAWKLAKSIGNEFYAKIFGKSMYNYRNVFDPVTGFMRGRDKEGNWTEPFDPEEWGGAYVEGDAWHYTWSVFQDVQGLINLFGGDKAFTDKLDAVFTTEPAMKKGTYWEIIHEMTEMKLAEMGQYAHGNQPIQHMPYLYCYAGQPWKTQYWVRQIMSRLYSSGPQGYPGDEDQGGMSSWYVLSALGIYAVTPGTDQYVLGSPVFRNATISLDGGKTFKIIAEGNSLENVYIQSATLNGKPLDANYITYSDIMNGGELHLVMGQEPSYSRGTSKAAAPYSLSQGNTMDLTINGCATTMEHDWMLGPFSKVLEANPCLIPDNTFSFKDPIRKENIKWQARNAYNPAAIVKDGKVYLLFRAEDMEGAYNGTSRVGLAVSEDGFHFTSLAEPVIFPDEDEFKEKEWEGGCEDPRIVETENGDYFIYYTSYNGHTVNLCCAQSRDLIHWKKHGNIFASSLKGKYSEIWAKSGAIVCRQDGEHFYPVKLRGKYWMYWGESNIYAATSDNLIDWTPVEFYCEGPAIPEKKISVVDYEGNETPFDSEKRLLPIVTPRLDGPDEILCEPGPQAILTEKGIVLIYNGFGRNAEGGRVYAGEQLLLSTESPTAVISRTTKPFLTPSEPYDFWRWSRTGKDGNCFLENLVYFKGRYIMYYGAADHEVAMAWTDPIPPIR